MARLFKSVEDVEAFMSELTTLSPIDDEDLELFIDKAEEYLKPTAESVGKTFQPTDRRLLREVNKNFGKGRCKTVVGVLNLLSESARKNLFTTEEETVITAMLDIAVIPTIGITPEA